MEVVNGDSFIIAVISTEFFGMAMLELGYNLSNHAGWTPFLYFVLIAITAKISGGHLNPAITLAVYIE